MVADRKSNTARSPTVHMTHPSLQSGLLRRGSLCLPAVSGDESVTLSIPIQAHL